MAKKTPLPKEIFVYEEADGNEKYLCAYRSKFQAADAAEKRLIGTYQLVETGEIEYVAKYTKR